MKSGNPRRHAAPRIGLEPGYGEGFSADRRHFVFHQQELARRALNLGAPGAARAALRALQAADFEDSPAALERLRVIRDASVTQDEVVEAIKELLLPRLVR